MTYLKKFFSNGILILIVIFAAVVSIVSSEKIDMFLIVMFFATFIFLFKIRLQKKCKKYR